MGEAAEPLRKTRGRLNKEQLEQIRSAIQVYIDHGAKPVWAQISRELNMFDSNHNPVLGRRIEDLWYSTLCPESVMKRGDPTHDEYMALRATMDQTSGYGKMVPGRTAQWVANTRKTSGFKEFCAQQDHLEQQQMMTNGIRPIPSDSVQRLEDALNKDAIGKGRPYAFSSPERYQEYEAFVQKEDIPAAESVPRSDYTYAPPLTHSPFRVEGVEANFFDQSPGSANTGFSEFGPFSSSVDPSSGFSGGKAYKKSRKSSRKARKSSRKAHKKSSRKLFRKARKSSSRK
jgi:hypothetical protein